MGRPRTCLSILSSILSSLSRLTVDKRNRNKMLNVTTDYRNVAIKCYNKIEENEKTTWLKHGSDSFKTIIV